MDHRDTSFQPPKKSYLECVHFRSYLAESRSKEGNIRLNLMSTCSSHMFSPHEDVITFQTLIPRTERGIPPLAQDIAKLEVIVLPIRQEL
jgi:hypothetical protein